MALQVAFALIDCLSDALFVVYAWNAEGLRTVAIAAAAVMGVTFLISLAALVRNFARALEDKVRSLCVAAVCVRAACLEAERTLPV